MSLPVLRRPVLFLCFSSFFMFQLALAAPSRPCRQRARENHRRVGAVLPGVNVTITVRTATPRTL
jgi:hypothetical protein